ncbi:MAG: Ppx/GppA family phosphatase [Paenibacillus sp.]|nr:Ppx/GppA family phosphatase [Paenibacillus sp.]
MTTSKRTGIIDIGSNSVRLVIYDRIDESAYRVIDESKVSVRLSASIYPDGSIGSEDIGRLARILNDFVLLCNVHKADTIRAVATAAIRNATNGPFVIEQLLKKTGLAIEILSGDEEARLGFLGMINATHIADGFLIDIGGGSTEVSLFRNRKLVNSISFPFGAVNTAKHYADGEGSMSKESAKKLKDMIAAASKGEPWLLGHPDLPLVGLGGTIRSLCKIDQKAKKYMFPQTHHYEIAKADLEQMAEWLPGLSAKQREKVDGLSDERADIIVPGLLILHSLFEYIGASRLIVSGAGLRDGLFHETAFPDKPMRMNVLAESSRNLLVLHPAVSREHAEHVSRLAVQLFEDMGLLPVYGARVLNLLETSALLYRIGVTIHYYNYYKHTFYLIINSRIEGLSHRESVLCALIASFQSRSRARSMMTPYKELLTEEDLELVYRLGSLVSLAAALDRSETQHIETIRARIDQQTLQLQWQGRPEPTIELKQVDRISGEFKKCWGLRITWGLPSI